MRTIDALPEWKRKRIARETLDIYAPLAHRLGIQEIKWQLKDLSFETEHPKRFAEIAQMVATRAPRRELELAEVLEAMRGRLSDLGIEAEVTGRPKHLWSIYEKMVVRSKEFDEITDLVAIRVIVAAEKDCWAALGVVHSLWPPVPGRFKDYINSPKFNLYQSLHTTVVGPHGKPVEVQVRTYEMHERAEHGIAAHWGYKEAPQRSSGRGARSTDEIAWLQRIMDWERETPDPQEFLETLKEDLEYDEVYVFTPKGEIMTLPAGATPVDFAYSIHTEVGHRCVGARVNGRLVPLETHLKSGDTVEIVTSKIRSAGPSRDWLKIVTSPRARNKIRQWFSRERREDAIEAGARSSRRRCAVPACPCRSSRAPRAAVDRSQSRLRGPRHPARRPRRGPRLRPVHRAAAGAGAAWRRRGAAAAVDRPHAAAPLEPSRSTCHLRRRPRRRHGAPVPLLHARAGRPRGRFHHERPRRVRAPGGLRERAGARRERVGAPHRGRVGRGPARRVRRRDRGESARIATAYWPMPPASCPSIT